MNNTLVIIGAGGHGRVVAECAETIGNYQQILFLDDCFGERKNNAHWPIVDKVAGWVNYVNTPEFIVAFGDNTLRVAMQNQLELAGVNVISLIHPQAVVSKYTTIGAGTVVFAGAVINIGTTVGKTCIINTSASIDHDCTLAQGVHISPNVSLAGGVNVGAGSWLGIGSIVIQYLSIAEHCQIGAGGVVIKNLDKAGVYVGNPIHRIK